MPLGEVKLATYTYNLERGWNLIGLTLNPTAESEQELLSHLIYEFNGNRRVKAFCQPGDFAAGRAYWIYCEQNESLVVRGTPVGDLVQDSSEEETGTYKLMVGPISYNDVGDEVTVTASEKEGYSFTGWTVDGVSLPDMTQPTATFTMPFHDVTLTPNYATTYILTVDGVAEERECGTTISVTAEDREGYVFTEWTIEGITVADTAAKQLKFTMPANDVTLTSNYATAFTLTVDGVVSQRGCGTTVTLTAEGKDGKTFGGWWNISGVSGIENTPTISFTMPDNDVSLDSYYYDNGEYLVVNLETGASRTSLTSPDLSDDTCRTTELWLRKIPAGTFMMGRSPEDEVGRIQSGETYHEVTLTEDFYIGVFEMTQRQYELITGQRPSSFNNDSCYATRPVEMVSYNMIRGATETLGAGWPTYGHAVDSDSLLGKLRTQTGLAFDLPTEAQWEYACRAGTTTALNTGKNLTSTSQDANMDEVGRYKHNGGSEYSQSCDTSAGTAKVGCYLPNVWGLYDMHGNVGEICLDWFEELRSNDAIDDPVGPHTAGACHLLRGGTWYDIARNCRSACRSLHNPCDTFDLNGFRVVVLPETP